MNPGRSIYLSNFSCLPTSQVKNSKEETHNITFFKGLRAVAWPWWLVEKLKPEPSFYCRIGLLTIWYQREQRKLKVPAEPAPGRRKLYSHVNIQTGSMQQGEIQPRLWIQLFKVGRFKSCLHWPTFEDILYGTIASPPRLPSFLMRLLDLFAAGAPRCYRVDNACSCWWRSPISLLMQKYSNNRINSSFNFFNKFTKINFFG